LTGRVIRGPVLLGHGQDVTALNNGDHRASQVVRLKVCRQTPLRPGHANDSGQHLAKPGEGLGDRLTKTVISHYRLVLRHPTDSAAFERITREGEVGSEDLERVLKVLERGFPGIQLDLAVVIQSCQPEIPLGREVVIVTVTSFKVLSIITRETLALAKRVCTYFLILSSSANLSP